MRSRRAKGQALKTVCVHTDTVSYLNCFAREDISVKGKGERVGQVRCCATQRELERDLGLVGDIVAVSRSRERGRVRRQE